MQDGQHGLENKDATGLFESAEVNAAVSIVEQTADELLAHVRTTSLYFEIDSRNRRAFRGGQPRLIESFGGVVALLGDSANDCKTLK